MPFSLQLADSGFSLTSFAAQLLYFILVSLRIKDDVLLPSLGHHVDPKADLTSGLSGF